MSQTIAAAFYRGDKTFAVEQTEVQQPGPGEVSVRVAYCGICGTDMHVFHGNMDARVGLNRILGHEMSGVIEALGEDVTGLNVGQKAVVRPLDPDLNCLSHHMSSASAHRRVGGFQFFPVKCNPDSRIVRGGGQMLFDLQGAQCVLINRKAVHFEPARMRLRRHQ